MFQLVISSCVILKCVVGPSAVEEHRILFLLQLAVNVLSLRHILIEVNGVASGVNQDLILV